MRNLILTFFVVLAALISSCGKKQVGPDNKTLSDSLYSQIAKNNGGEKTKNSFEVEKFEVLVVENTGNEVEPNIVGRFQASLKTIKPLYKLSDRLPPNYYVLEVTSSKGLITPMTGQYNSTVKSVTSKNTNWNTRFEIDEIVENPWNGYPIEHYENNTHKILFKGSDEEKKIRAEIAAEKARKEAKIAAEKARIKAEKEKYARERQAYKNAIAGTWVSSAPFMLKSTGKPYNFAGRGKKDQKPCLYGVNGAGLRLNIPKDFDESSSALKFEHGLMIKDTGLFTTEFKWRGPRTQNLKIEVSKDLKTFTFMRHANSVSCYTTDPDDGFYGLRYLTPEGKYKFEGKVNGNRMFLEGRNLRKKDGDQIVTMELVKQ